MKHRRLTSKEQRERLENIVQEIPNLKEWSVDWAYNGDEYYKIGITTHAEIYPDFTMEREALDEMTDAEIMEDLKGEMKAWDARMSGKHSSIGAEPMAENQTTATAS